MTAKKSPKRRKSEDLGKLFLGNYSAHSRFAESFRTLRTSVRFSFMEKDFRSILITSAGGEEGKSTTVANLAYTMANAGKSVLMMDADLRKPMLNLMVSCQENSGLTGLLSDVFGREVQSGSLDGMSVGDLFRLLSFQKKTGVLHLVEGKEKIDFGFLNGEPEDIHWHTRPIGKKLASLLVKNKVITKGQAEQALIRKKNTGQKLGFVLINMGLVKESDLTGFITLHMIEALRTALQFKSGEFLFENFPESRFEKPSFAPADLDQLYRQLIVGEEELPYLQDRINSFITETNMENLYLLPSGPPPPNPTELLDSNRMSFLLAYLTRRFDRVVIDSPPILPATDAIILAPQVDGVALIVKAGHINREIIKKAVDQLRVAKANLIGVILNQVDVTREGYYKHYNKYYSKYYGEETQ